MKVWGVTEYEANTLADRFGLKLENPRRSGKAYQFRIGVLPGTPRRRSAGFGGRRGRLVQSPTFARMAMFLLALFDQGSYRIQSTMGNWTNGNQFVDDLHRIAGTNIGSQMYPASIGDPELNEEDPAMENALNKIAGYY